MNKTAAMTKALSALAVSAVIAAALTLMPSFAPEVEAGVPHLLAKSDKLAVRPVDASCDRQTWPNISGSCLRTTSRGDVKNVRMVQPNRG